MYLWVPRQSTLRRAINPLNELRGALSRFSLREKPCATPWKIKATQLMSHAVIGAMFTDPFRSEFLDHYPAHLRLFVVAKSC